jgi:hypothetical protein
LANDLVGLIKNNTELNTPDENGNTLKQSLEFASKNMPSHWQRDTRLDAIAFNSPDRYHLYGAALLTLYHSMSAGRQTGYNGVQSISWSDMQSWIAINNYIFSEYEIETLKALDLAYIETIHRIISERTK